MARIRTIKPEYWSSPDTASVDDPWARLLFIAMWNWADDMGRGVANPKELAGFAFPNDEKIDSADIRRMLGGIRRGFGVTFYQVRGRPYYAIPSWDGHQKIDKRSGGKHPAPEEGEEWNPDPNGPPDLPRHPNSAESAESSEDSTESPPSSRRVPGAGTGEQGNRGTGEEETPSAADATEPVASLPEPDPFDEFWAAYPRKVEKRAAEKAWRAALKRKAKPEQIIAAANAYAARSRGVEARFVKHPASWLNAGAHDDLPETAIARATPTFDDLRQRGAALDAARLIRALWIEPAQPPDDPTPYRQWLHARAVEFIDAHEPELRTALAERNTG